MPGNQVSPILFILLSICSFIASFFTSSMVFVGFFSTRIEDINKSPEDRTLLLTLGILVPVFMILGWAIILIGRRFGSMKVAYILGIIFTILVILYYCIFSLPLLIQLL